MKNHKTKLFITAFLLLTNIIQLSACSAFMLKGEGYHLIGFNENWKTMPGMVVVNKRGLAKQSLSWDYMASPGSVIGKTKNWTSKYGSLTFNLLGYDLPCYGLNEKGLFMVELYLETTTSVTDASRPNMFWAQWIQYQLDNYATVKEVADNLDNIPVIDWWPQATGSHFFVTDKQGNSAAIELLNGKYSVTMGADMPLPVVCNGEYKKELAAINKYDFMGGAEKYNYNPDEKNWDTRYTKAAYQVKTFDPKKANPLDYSWRVLNSVFPGEWQTVFDVKNGKMFWKSNVGTAIKSIDLAQIDFSKKAEIVYFDINSTASGNVTTQFKKLTPDVNSKYILEGFPVGYDNKNFPQSDAFKNIQRNLDTHFRKTTTTKK
jgi:penicillin V acylase-like amidase (Ntn superfamily)